VRSSDRHDRCIRALPHTRRRPHRRREGDATTTETGRHEQSDVGSERIVPTLRDLEAHHIAHVLGLAGGNQRHAARLLGITRWSLARRLKKYGLPTASLLAVLALVVPAAATRIPGGDDPRTDCYAQLEVDGAAASGRVAQCTDGDTRCDADGTANDSCRFRVALCLNQDTARPTCVPPGMLRDVRTRRAAAGLAVPPLDSSACGAFVDVDVPVKLRRGGRVRRPGKVHLPVTARSSITPRTDRDNAMLVCLPAGSVPSPAACPRNPDGPNELVLIVKSEGTDLDNGWAGPSLNLPIPAGTTLQMCLGGCDDRDPICDTTVNTGVGTFNGETFGPPLPVLVAGVPSCIVNEFQSPVFTGTANLQTGAIDGTVFVAGSPAANKMFPLSKDCPPAAGARAGTLEITLPLTTGTSTLAPEPGAKPETPCVRQPGEPAGVTPAPDMCRDGGVCTAGGCAGPQTCARRGIDASTGEAVCIDAKGGTSQYCCSNDPGRACQPTRAGNPIGVVERVGHAETPRDANGMVYGAGDYPKRSDVVSVATFCEGPGAIVLPAAAEWRRAAR